MTPAASLLLRALRSGVSEEKDVAAEPLDDALCRDVVDLALDTRLSFQVLAWLERGNNFTEMSSECVKKLLPQVREAAARNALQRFHAAQLLQRCAERGIPVILTKGLWLAECVYRDAGARDACDVDLLLRPEHVPAFTGVARELGFDVPADGEHLASDAATTNEFALWHRASGVLVDVHWSVTNPVSEAAVDEGSLWNASELVELAGMPCRTLALEDHLLYLCFHAAVHHRFWAVGPRCLLDVAMVLRQPPREIRWDWLVTRARELGWQKPAWLIFALVEEHLGVAAPPLAMQALHDSRPEDAEVCRSAVEAIFAARAQDSLYRHLAHLLEMRSWRQRASALGRLVVPSRAQMTNQFGLSDGTDTWRLHVRRWRTKASGLFRTAGGLVLGSGAHREELARTRRIQGWLMQPPTRSGGFTVAQVAAGCVALVAIPVFALLVRFMALPRLLARVECAGEDAGLHLRVPEATALGRAVNIAAARGPWPAKCLTRSLVLHWLLQRRGIRSVLRIGVANADAFRAHAWVECAGVPVNDRADVATVFTPFESLSLDRGEVPS